jgi:DNA ligase (NAD+)
VSDFDEFSSPHSWILSPLGEKGTAYSNMIYYLQELGFSISSYFPKCFWIEQVIHAIENIWDIKSKIDFEIDGLVVKLDDISLWQEVWFTEHHPRYAIAYKFPAEIVTTKLESVEHSVGRTGTITPVANLTPVNIWGAIIRRATLHNYDEVEKLGVKIGDIVFLKRAWEVIPKIISVASSASETGLTGDRSPVISPPNHCPSCWNQVCKDEQKVRYYCPNVYGCPAQMQEKLAFAVGKQWFNIDWFGERQAGLFYRLDYITKFWDIFRLKDYKNEILLLDGFKEKSVQNLLAGIEKVRNTDIVTFLKALWIPGVGKKTAKTLGKYIEQMQPHLSLQERIERGIIWEGATEKLLQLPDIWPEVAESVIEFFTSQEDLVTDLLSELVIELPELAIGEWNQQWGRYTWKKVCITGSFEWYKREQLAELLELQGWEFMGSVSVKTDYLLAWDKAGSKLKKAQELWVKILSLEEFLA